MHVIRRAERSRRTIPGRKAAGAALAGLLLVPALGLAQFIVRPQIIPSAIRPADGNIFNIADLAEDTVPPELEWRVTVPQTSSHDYELTFDVGASTSSPTPARVPMADTTSDRNSGAAVNNRTYVHRIRYADLLRASERPENGGVNEGRRNVVLRVFRSGDPTNEANAGSFTWTFQYDTRLPPIPAFRRVEAGDRRLRVVWDAPTDDTDVTFYEVLYLPQVATSTEGLTLTPNTPGIQTRRVDRTQRSVSLEADLANGVPVAFALRAIDPLDNVGRLGPTHFGVPRQVVDYWQLYKSQGGDEEGGFCFIATAAYGSYAHPAVGLLRLFRDRALLPSLPGRAFVTAYYRLSPPWAARVAADPGLAGAVRLVLWPLALTASLFLLAPVLGALILAHLYSTRRRRARRGLVRPLASLVLAALIGSATRAEAAPRPGAETAWGLALQFKGGPFQPAMADPEVASGPGTGAFQSVFGDKTRPLFSLGADWQFFRKFGSAGVGGGFGFMQYVGKGRYADTGQASADTTVFNMLPLTLTAFYRFDVLADRFSIPLVPYLRGGLVYQIWWVTNGRGEISLFEPGGGAEPTEGRGGKLGLTGTLGIALLLNTIDSKSAAALYESAGIRGTYVFIEVEAQEVDGFGAAGFDFSDTSWNVGVYFEF